MVKADSQRHYDRFTVRKRVDSVPEMLSELERFWAGDPDWADVIAYCEQMTKLRSDIHKKRGILPPMMTCRSCGQRHAMTLSPVSPRSLLFALQKIDVIADEELRSGFLQSANPAAAKKRCNDL